MYIEERKSSGLTIGGSSARFASTIFTILMIIIAAGIYVWYSRVSNDPTPDSIAGYSFAIAGTFFLVLATVSYARYRNMQKHSVSQMNAKLNWHIAFGIVALFLLLLHCFGNLNPRSGTYALYAMIALVISGAIGKWMDRVLPKMITKEASKALTMQGEDRIESLSREVHSTLVYNSQRLSGFQVDNRGGAMQSAPASRATVSPTLESSWDLAYISTGELPQEVARDNVQYRFVPDRKSPLADPGALMPGVKDQMQEIKRVQHSMERERTYRYIIRYWRIFHVILAIVTVGLTLWHLEFAFSLLIPVWLHSL
jgi:lipoprotein signal peptidase